MMKSVDKIALIALCVALALLSSCRKAELPNVPENRQGTQDKQPLEMIDLEHPIVLGISVLPSQVVDLNQPRTRGALRAEQGSYTEADFARSTVNRPPGEDPDCLYDAEVGEDWIRNIVLFADGEELKQGVDYDVEGLVGGPVLNQNDFVPKVPWKYDSSLPAPSKQVVVKIYRLPKDMPKNLEVFANAQAITVGDHRDPDTVDVSYINTRNSPCLTAWPNTPSTCCDYEEILFLKTNEEIYVDSTLPYLRTYMAPSNLPMYGKVSDCDINPDTFEFTGKQWGQATREEIKTIYLERAVAKIEVTFDEYVATDPSDQQERMYWLDELRPGDFPNIITIVPGYENYNRNVDGARQLLEGLGAPDDGMPFIWRNKAVRYGYLYGYGRYWRRETDFVIQPECEQISPQEQYQIEHDNYLGLTKEEIENDPDNRYTKYINDKLRSGVKRPREVAMYLPESYEPARSKFPEEILSNSKDYETTIRIGISELFATGDPVNPYEYLTVNAHYQKNTKILNMVVGEKNANGFHELARNTCYRLHIRLGDVLRGTFKVLPYKIVDLDSEIDPEANDNQAYDWTIPRALRCNPLAYVAEYNVTRSGTWDKGQTIPTAQNEDELLLTWNDATERYNRPRSIKGSSCEYSMPNYLQWRSIFPCQTNISLGGGNTIVENHREIVEVAGETFEATQDFRPGTYTINGQSVKGCVGLRFRGNNPQEKRFKSAWLYYYGEQDGKKGLHIYCIPLAYAVGPKPISFGQICENKFWETNIPHAVHRFFPAAGRITYFGQKKIEKRGEMGYYWLRTQYFGDRYNAVMVYFGDNVMAQDGNGVLLDTRASIRLFSLTPAK